MGARIVIHCAIRSNPLGWMRTMSLTRKPAFSQRSLRFEAMPCARSGLPSVLFDSLLRAQRKQRSFGIDHFVADFDILLFVDERLCELRIVSGSFSGTAKVTREVGNNLRIYGLLRWSRRTCGWWSRSPRNTSIAGNRSSTLSRRAIWA